MIGNRSFDWLPLIGKHVLIVIAQQFFQYFDCICIQWYTSRRSVFGLVEPRSASIEVYTFLFKASNLPGSASSG